MHTAMARIRASSCPGATSTPYESRKLQRLVELKAGTGRREGKNKEVVDFGSIIGLFRATPSGPGVPTTVGTIHYSKTGAHVVPARPNPTKKQGSGR
ncbi:MAG: polymorphic toxin type 50 domain-containing protein [Candidatus Nanopelagicales bacterium]